MFDLRFQNTLGQPNMVSITALTLAGVGGLEAVLPITESFGVVAGVPCIVREKAALEMAVQLESSGLSIERLDRTLPPEPIAVVTAEIIGTATHDAERKAEAEKAFTHYLIAKRGEANEANLRWALSMDIRDKASAIAGMYAGGGDSAMAVRLLRTMADALEAVTS